MNKLLAGGLASAAILAAVAAGFRLGAGRWPDTSHLATLAHEAPAPEHAHARKVLYWRHPSDEAEFSAQARKTEDGRDYVPVYDDQEADFANARPKGEAPPPNRKILYYRNPMGLPDTSPTPKKDSMGMDYIPVYEGDGDDGSTVKVSVAKVQRTGVRTEPVMRRHVMRPVRAPGVAKPDERTLYSVTLRADSFIEKLYVNENGRHVEKGDPLFRIYSPDMVKVQVDYRISRNAGGERSEAGATQRLENLGLPKPVVEQLKRSGEPVLSFDWPSPVTGFVLRKNALEGMMAKTGDEIFRIADLSSIWVIADVAEQDIGQVHAGDKAKVTFRAFPGEVFEGDVTFILHELDMATRTAHVRIQLANPDHRIKHEMFADVEIDTQPGRAEELAVPASALIDSGRRQVVIVDLGDGRFEPRDVKTGLRGEGYVAIREGLKEGENVVVAANFLIDAESNLKAALAGFAGEAGAEPAAGHHAHSHDGSAGQ
ncbi:MAG TPA: efflux RND transporter periplasmic adaptor subunit [Hyphomicrobium sp.]|nr:efflux RND transporter periplasmic adaptor subunit [Hyphomicrobium sp.]